MTPDAEDYDHCVDPNDQPFSDSEKNLRINSSPQVFPIRPPAGSLQLPVNEAMALTRVQGFVWKVSPQSFRETSHGFHGAFFHRSFIKR